MDDQFLHRLRRDPPARFVIQLKWQLDRSTRGRTLRYRMILALALCGTAFALVSPPGRQVIRDWVAPPSQIAPPASSAVTPGKLPPWGGITGVSPARNSQGNPGALTDSVPAALPAPLPVPQAAAEAPASEPGNAQPFVATVMVPVAILGSPQQTPQMMARNAIQVRQGLFLTMVAAMQPLYEMQEHRVPADFYAVRRSAERLAMLSSMIPELFRLDTRPFEVSTSAADLIWIHPVDFAQKADAMTRSAQMLARYAANADERELGRQIQMIQTACSSCHALYRSNIRR